MARDRLRLVSRPPQRAGREAGDPIDDEDLEVLRHEILRLRDHAIGQDSRAEVLTDRVSELEAELHELGAINEELARELARNPLLRLARGVRLRLRRLRS